MRVVLHKARGETPLRTIERFKATHPAYASLPACYAGRLDPMASGKLLVLLGDACKRKDRYQKLDKEYVVEVLLDVSSDTGDVLGIVERTAHETIMPPDLRRSLRILKGTHELPYPAFSSKTVHGKPLFLHALEGTLATIQIPRHSETVYRIDVTGVRTLSADELRARVDEALSLVPRTDEPSKALGADFRIEAVRASWEEALRAPRSYAVLTLTVACGSGTYMRTLAGRLGEVLSTKALALSITRTRIGRYLPFLRWWRDIDSTVIDGV